MPLLLLTLTAGVTGVCPAPLYIRALQGIIAVTGMVMAAELVAAFGLLCPSCHRWVLLQMHPPFHPAARAWIVGGRFGPIARDVLRRRRFTCMYCGRGCRVDGG